MIAAERYDRDLMQRFALRPSRAAVCPRVVAGRHCRLGTERLGELCLCQRFAALLDHQRIWLDASGAHLLTCEPYDLDCRRPEVLACRDCCRQLGLALDVTPYSFWFDGTTLLVIRPHARPPLMLPS